MRRIEKTVEKGYDDGRYVQEPPPPEYDYRNTWCGDDDDEEEEDDDDERSEKIGKSIYYLKVLSTRYWYI